MSDVITHLFGWLVFILNALQFTENLLGFSDHNWDAVIVLKHWQFNQPKLSW